MSSGKFKPNKGLRKRVRISSGGKIKVGRAGGRHRKSLHTSSQNRQLRRPKTTCAADQGRVALMLGIKLKRRPSSPAITKADTEQPSTE